MEISTNEFFIIDGENKKITENLEHGIAALKENYQAIDDEAIDILLYRVKLTEEKWDMTQISWKEIAKKLLVKKEMEEATSVDISDTFFIVDQSDEKWIFDTREDAIEQLSGTDNPLSGAIYTVDTSKEKWSITQIPPIEVGNEIIQLIKNKE